jgi:hypothetical protein
MEEREGKEASDGSFAGVLGEGVRSCRSSGVAEWGRAESV